jgi:hypothetical protein
MTNTADENIIARLWRGQLHIIVLFQLTGVFFILFYYPELVFRMHNWLAPTYALHETVNALLLWVYDRTNTLQLLLSDQYHFLILAALTATSTVLVLILATTLRRMDFSVLLRAIFFLAIGLLAIPIVLLAYILRWIPGAIFSFLAGIFGAITSVFTFLAPYVGSAIIAIVVIVVSLVVVFALARTATGRIILALAVVLLGSLMFFPELLNTLTTVALGAWGVAGNIASYPIAGLGYVFGFIGAILTFIFSALLLLIPLMFVISQFGHIFIDSLFDARNVRRSARAAGRFLVGIGFLTSTILLCLPENQLARGGAAQAYVTASHMIGGNADYEEGAKLASDLGSAYLALIPDEVEPAIVLAFSYGYPPSLELIFVTLACVIAFFLIARQLSASSKEERFGIAFFPAELVFLLIGAVLVVLVALAAADDAGG